MVFAVLCHVSFHWRFSITLLTPYTNFLHSLIKSNQWKTLTNQCVFDIFCCLEQIHETLNDLPHFLTSGQQFSRLKGEEVGNWSGLISYPDDGGMKPARNGRKRYKPAQIPLNTTTNTLERQWERIPHRQWSAACMSGLETHPIPSANQTSRNKQLWLLKPIFRANYRTRTDQSFTFRLPKEKLNTAMMASGRIFPIRFLRKQPDMKWNFDLKQNILKKVWKKPQTFRSVWFCSQWNTSLLHTV